MRCPLLQYAICAAVILAMSADESFGKDPAVKVRAPSVAGTWYPGDARRLAAQIDEWLSTAPSSKLEGKPIALIAPHAGYRFSGKVAAAGYAALRGHSYKRVIVLAFSHRYAGSYSGVDVPADLTAYATPLGEVPIDRKVVDDLRKRSGFVSQLGVDRGEHSLELQLPFLQRVLGEFQLVPILVGKMTPAQHATVARALLDWIDNDTLLVASTDFTHFGPNYRYQPFSKNVPDELRKLAEQAAEPITQCNFDGFFAHLSKTQDTVCGRQPVALLLRILSMQGGAKGIVAAFDTSGRMTGDWTNSVTYQSILFTARPGNLNLEERRRLLDLARRTVTAQLKGDSLPTVNADEFPEALRSQGACFVTLKNRGQLRGCIGNMQATGPLYRAVVDNAVSACSRDRRFAGNPVTVKELDDIDIEISYLTPMKLVENTEGIVIGQHGLYIMLGPKRGVLLPQVAYERGWTRPQFLERTCRKAGLPLDAWKREDAKIYSFEAEVFGEEQATTQPSPQ